MNKLRVLIVFGLGVGFLWSSVPVADATLIINEDFNSPAVGFTFNGSAFQDLTSGTAVLTQAAGNQRGSVYSNTAIYVDHFVARFDFSFSQTSGLNGGGDGIVFSVLGPPSGPTSLGAGGAQFGWAPVANSFAIEFDTFNDNANYVPIEINDNHVGLDVNGATGNLSLAVAPVPVPMKNGGWFSATVEFNKGNVNVFLENPSLGLPETLVLNTMLPGFVPFDGYFGFAGGTGAAVARQAVDNFEVSVPVPEPSTLLVVVSGFATWGALRWRRHRRG